MFIEQLADYQSSNRPIIYLDEFGFKTSSYRPYAYAPRGQKCFDSYNWQLKSTTNAIGAIHGNQLFAVGLYDFNVNADVFYHWTKNLLLPALSPHSLIVMDNARFHIREDIKNLIEQAGHTILWLPPYSPDLNPIEHIWAWIKRLRQDWRLDDIDKLFFYFMWICGSF